MTLFYTILVYKHFKEDTHPVFFFLFYFSVKKIQNRYKHKFILWQNTFLSSQWQKLYLLGFICSLFWEEAFISFSGSTFTFFVRGVGSIKKNGWGKKSRACKMSDWLHYVFRPFSCTSFHSKSVMNLSFQCGARSETGRWKPHKSRHWPLNLWSQKAWHQVLLLLLCQCPQCPLYFFLIRFNDPLPF